MDFDDFERRVCAAVAESTGVRPGRVTPDRPLCAGRGSLGIDEADADDLSALLRERFGTTFVGFPRDAYFGPERSFDPLSFVYRSVVGRQRPLRPLTVGELARYMSREEPSPPPMKNLDRFRSRTDGADRTAGRGARPRRWQGRG